MTFPQPEKPVPLTGMNVCLGWSSLHMPVPAVSNVPGPLPEWAEGVPIGGTQRGNDWAQNWSADVSK